jgi:oligoendopeptidase F
MLGFVDSDILVAILSRLDSFRDEFLGKLAEVETKINARIDQVEANLNARIDQVEANLNARIDQVEANLNARIDQVEANLNARIDQVEANLNARIDQVETNLNARIDARVEALRNEVIEGLRQHGTETLNVIAASVERIRFEVRAANRLVRGQYTELATIQDDLDERVTALEQRQRP